MRPRLPSRQTWLLPYANPLDERLGLEFFCNLPQCPGVYRMLGEQDAVLYVGKAKNLKARLYSYRRAKPDQVSRKTIRLINLIRAIRIETVATEKDALLLENARIREYRPPFNVVNARPESYYFISLTRQENWLRLGLTAHPQAPCDHLYGAYKGRRSVREGYAALLRLLWAALENSRESPGQARIEAPGEAKPRFEYPSALTRARVPYSYALRFKQPDDLFYWLRRFLAGTSRTLLEKLTERLLLNADIPPFYYHYIQEDLESLERLYRQGPWRNRRLRRQLGITEPLIAQERLDDLIVLARPDPA